MPESNARPKSRASLKQELIRQDIDEKWKRVMMTPTGIKIIRIQPSINNDSLLKYQSRPPTSSSFSGSSSPRHTSTPTKGRTISSVPPSQRPSTSMQKNNGRAVSAASIRSTGTQTSLEGTPRAGVVLEKPPAPARPASSRSNHSATFNSRSQSCQPPHMYMSDDLRRAVKHNRPASHVHSCGITEDKQPPSPRRYDGTVVNLPRFMKGNEFLTHEDLTLGQKQYIWGIARIYSVSNLMQLKQRQYQSLLDYDFNRRIQNKYLKEHEIRKEWREYARYSKFIKRQDLRIPRVARHQGSTATPCEQVTHIHRHAVKGWTTNPHSDEAYRHKQKEQREEEEEAVRRLPDHSDNDDEESSPDSISGRYEVVLIKTPRKEVSEDERTSENEEQISSSANSSQNEVKEDDSTNIERNDYTREHLSDGEESNYL